MTRRTPEHLERFLQRLARRRLAVTWTSNASNYLSFTPARGTIRVRMHRAFLYAPAVVVRRIADWLAGRVAECPDEVRRFIDRPPPEVRRMVRTPSERLRPHGRCYDLQTILDRLGARYCRRPVRVRITWGRRIRQQAVYARTLGAYYEDEKLIVMNPVLDQWAVPEWFLAYTVFHELLHAVQPRGEPPHGPWFERALAGHPDHAAADRWELANVGLLTGRRWGSEGDRHVLPDCRWREHLDL